ncbi:hydantoinase/oxoprolinase family protein [Brevibacterium sp. SMBL_HHYL_HB1]|uniref:hydantoinase/oxoprolinase family protein n=1 Tax=Brevibacterium sp. SMBL_HHYL_HB1 TaxID=2777556 RepID=UPI001BA8D3DF|nr:hydantoinase/oxoprolinase family protein [Brevibacterium sp. SMBL_HHYL_HB1]QUL77884.1 hydantoinase/oxoprolinase family protein [Brevibacterium sp. SMBL_HHYL_HB1]
MRIGVECGGTFTDLVVLDDDGRLRSTDKVFSTPADPSEAVRTALHRLNSHLTNGAEILHGSTVATNALIERKGARVGLIVTSGFKDIVFLQRQDRAQMYDLKLVKPEPLVARADIIEIDERLNETGEPLRSIDVQQARSAVKRLIDRGVDAIAVSLLHSYANPDHEAIVAQIVHELAPEMTIALSSQSAREFREYERTTTTTIDAFLRPRVANYIDRLTADVAQLGSRAMQVMQSNGGTVPAQTASRNPLTMLRSGPAAGVAGAIAVAGAIGEQKIVTMDMGGTSTDVAVIRNGEADLTTETVADGLPVRVPMVDIVAVGAGGGSLADVDSGGLLTVGPQSAGADPGPVAYGRGGTQPTVTDANLVRGLLRPETFLGGKSQLNLTAAEQSLAQLGEQLGRTPSEVAEDIFRLASVHMATAIRMTTTERGHEVSEYTLCAYGGAGAMHAATVADELNIKKVIVPPYNGLASAYGLLTADFRREFSTTRLTNLSRIDDNGLRSFLNDLKTEALEQLKNEDAILESATFVFTADMRYVGQGFEVIVPISEPDSPNVTHLADSFSEVQERRYGFVDSNKDIQLVTLRLTVSVPAESTALPRVEIMSNDDMYQQPIVEHGKSVSAQFRRRNGLSIGTTIDGPSVIEDDTSTTYVPTGWVATVDDNTNLILERDHR